MNNERGIALPMALIVMVILTALMAAFAVLATSEPQIASNQVASAQARALAESGVERVLWALSVGQNSPLPSACSSSPTPCLVLDASYNLPSPMPSPYDGSTTVTLGVGSFKVTVADGALPNQKSVTAIGYVPNATNPIAIKKLQVTVMRFKMINPPCGICSGGEQPSDETTNVQVGGSAAVNLTADAQGKVAAGALCATGQPTLVGAVASTGTVSTNGTPNFYTTGSTPGTVNGTSFPSTMMLSDSDMATLKTLAMAQGTYYKGTPPWDGGLPPKNGLIFVDTPSGLPLCKYDNGHLNPATNSPCDSSGTNVSIHSNGSFNGWLVVAGSIDISGGVTISGLVYAQNDVTLHGTGNGSIQGAIVATNRLDTLSTNIDTEDIGNAPISYSCPNVRSGGGTISQNWFLVPGTYREVSGS